ncbi:phosphoglucomutase/phosphomannomutase family protein [Occallatibacter riparius]|uniref:Phosphoglucomutase/phosphomannomutase family protein n=1 Tax=Occallatibacter riparius TaxID=1002689 RepID=A0A9J7BSV8_9BACT|nr:phosphoglucomutase/phosphomannomutase family protein [Occallatibacter riparius]UWZ83990.1 phosphoglucomutase/phosphomannomutase family protein [Occallatibacter riparius]
MASAIKFGTSGWRAIVADEFTVANIRLAVAGIAEYVKTQPGPHRVLVGRDPRFLGESFVDTAARVLAGAGVTPVVIPDAAPTPAIAHAVRTFKTVGALNFTASHNPPEYNGIKYSSPDGAPALPEVTSQIEAAVNRIADSGAKIPQANPPDGGFETVDVKDSFLKRLGELVDLKAITKSGIKVVYDPFWGAGRGYSCRILRQAGVPVETVHDYRDVLFGGHAPEPDDHLLDAAKRKMREIGAKIVIATDGDADRFGIVDEDGTFIQPNYVIALLFDYLVETRGWRNGVAKSVATTNLVNALAEHHKVPLYETPVGFKYIGELIIEDKIAIGGEESAGLTIRGHVPEKDGIIAGLLVTEMVAVRGKSLGVQLRELFGKVGSYYPVRENFRLTPEVKARFTEKLKADPTELSGRKVKQVVRTDGLKLILDDGSWVCYRLSGTEPVVRAYTEARSEHDMEALKAAAEKFVTS